MRGGVRGVMKTNKHTHTQTHTHSLSFSLSHTQHTRSFNPQPQRITFARGRFLECNRCGARMSVQNVEKGFHATNRSDRKAAKAAK
jgi:hypothetical protein